MRYETHTFTTHDNPALHETVITVTAESYGDVLTITGSAGTAYRWVAGELIPCDTNAILDCYDADHHVTVSMQYNVWLATGEVGAKVAFCTEPEVQS